MNRTLTALSAALLTTALSAQTTVIFPPDHATVEGSSSSSDYPYAGGVGRNQGIYSRHFLNIPNGATITHVGIRPDAASTATGRQIQLEIRMGHCTLDIASVSSTFANNYATPAVTVFTQKIVTLPDLTGANPGPSTQYILMQLDTPFVYDATKNLIVDYIISANSAGNVAFTYPTDVASWIATRTTFGTSCTHSNGRVPALNTSNGFVNGTWNISLTNGLQNSPYTMHVGAGTSSWAGIPLPFPLDGLGAPNCSLLVEFPVTLSGRTSTSGTASIAAPVPNWIELNDVTFYAQVLILDLFANSLGVITTNGASTTFGIEPQFTYVDAANNPMAASGSRRIRNGHVGVFRYN
ncbi:MAG: hypothetical protein JNM84_23450 [Planctomycetes bacterium]|nr:hypothetical protein [Planctomycetota bacterium]